MKYLSLLIGLALLAFSAGAASPDYKAFRGTGIILLTTNPPTGTVVAGGQTYVLTNNQSTAVTLENGLTVNGLAGLDVTTQLNVDGSLNAVDATYTGQLTVFGITILNGPLTVGNVISTVTPYTVPITGTNFIIDWSALGGTNDLILTNYANAGLLNTNIIPGRLLKFTVPQGSQGFNKLIPNTNNFGPNIRFTAVQTGIVQSTNGGYEDFFSLYGSRTNAVLSGQNWGAAP